MVKESQKEKKNSNRVEGSKKTAVSKKKNKGKGIAVESSSPPKKNLPQKYDDLKDFKLLSTKTIDWEHLSKNPEYKSLHKKLDKMGWLGTTQFEYYKANKPAVKEFYTSIVVKKAEYSGKKEWDDSNLYAYVCGKEMIITASMLGLLLKIEDDEDIGHNTDAEDGNKAEADTLDQGKEATKSENMSAGIDKTNDSEVPSGTIPELTNMSLTTTAEVLVGLEPLAKAPASPKGKDKKKAPLHSAPSPVKDAFPSLKPKKKVTKKTSAATVEETLPATESDVAPDPIKVPPTVPQKRPRTKHPTLKKVVKQSLQQQQRKKRLFV
ncbi:hypothetical protein COLO4_28441 [Corchorus olitorius]|uniref:Uncharacterized protein n=1 Tax=Corchorus olitorius TaxID=93759 RepID=A0A1R3HKL1_9ROSI|nr:hypothetical protein COLO4_28441 [Corchorus olitorius]